MIHCIFIFSFFFFSWTQEINSCMRTNFKERSQTLQEIPLTSNFENPKRKRSPLSYFKVSIAPNQTHDRYSPKLFAYYCNTDIPMPIDTPFLNVKLTNMETDATRNAYMPKQLFEDSDNGSIVHFTSTAQPNSPPRRFYFICESNPTLTRNGKGTTFQEQLNNADHSSASHFLRQQEIALDERMPNPA